MNERRDGLAFVLGAGAQRLGGEGFGLPPGGISVLIDNDMMNFLLTKEAYDMIDRDKLVVNTCREDVKVREGS